jgi:beta-lactam-binding protein with PASTA domain
VAAGSASTGAAYSSGYAAGTVAATAPPPGATVTTVTTTTTSYAMGVSYAALPAGSMAVTKNGSTYYLSGNTWFQPMFGANGVHYQVVPTP